MCLPLWGKSQHLMCLCVCLNVDINDIIAVTVFLHRGGHVCSSVAHWQRSNASGVTFQIYCSVVNHMKAQRC